MLIVRQVGDQLDRGDDELPVLYFLERLAREAQVRTASTNAATSVKPPRHTSLKN